MSGQPWLTSTMSGGCGPEIARRSSVFSSLKSRLTRLTVTFGYLASSWVFRWSQILLTCPDSWSHTVSVIGPVSGTPVVAGAGGADACFTVPPGVHAAATVTATSAIVAIARRAEAVPRAPTARTLGADLDKVKTRVRFRFLSAQERSIIGACL